jgi:hypothetical protein
MFNTGIAKDLMAIVGATFSLTLVALVITKAGPVTQLIGSSVDGVSKLIKTATFQ